MTVSALKRLLNQNDILLKREGGNHDLYFSPLTGHTFPVPRHKTQELPMGTLSAILRQAGLEKTEVS